LQHGELAEQGTHAELLARGGAYAKLCEATFSKEAQHPNHTNRGSERLDL
jgi:hypothetical protein